MLEESRQAYGKVVTECNKSIREQVTQGEYISNMPAPFVMTSEV